MIFLSLCICSIRPANIIGMLDNLEATADDKSSFEALICVNEGDSAIMEALEAHRSKVSFSYRTVATPKREGYYSLHHGYEALRAVMAPSSYFAWQVSDEIRIDTHGWDTQLKRYIKLFDDDLFRLRLSLNRGRHYYSLYECFPLPDNYTVTARAWYDATGGSGDIWGPDSWHQAVDYFLGQLRNPYEPYGKGVFRSVPVYDVRLANEEAGQGLTTAQSGDRAMRIKKLYKRLCGLKAQENFLRIAQGVNMRIWMHGYIRENPAASLTLSDIAAQRRYEVRDASGALLTTGEYSIIPFLLRAAWKRWRRMLPNLRPIEYARYRMGKTQ